MLVLDLLRMAFWFWDQLYVELQILSASCAVAHRILVGNSQYLTFFQFKLRFKIKIKINFKPVMAFSLVVGM